MSTTTNLSTLKINYLYDAQYQTALDGGHINENEIYLTPSSEETFNNVEAVASLPYTPSHSGILTLYMLQNGTSAVWRSVRITDQTTNTHTDFGIYFAGTTYGGVSFHLPVIKGHTYIVASGGSDLYFEASRSYLTY